MNKIVLIATVIFLINVNLVSAIPIIQDVSVQPSSLWIGENTVISLNCFDSDSNEIKEVYANINGPDIVLPTLYFTKSDSSYSLTVSKDYLDRTGNFDATLYCKNNNSEINYTTTSFTVSRLTGYINEINPRPAYVGDVIEIGFKVMENDVELPSGVIFNVTINDQIKNLNVVPAFDSNKGWLLKIDSPAISGIYNLKVNAFYDRATVSDYDTLDVRNKIEFEIVSIDNLWVKSNDNVTVKLKALERGNVIELNKNNINIKIGSTNAEIIDVSRQDDLFSVKITVPSLSSGIYQLGTWLNYGGSSYFDDETINYIVPIKGNLGKGTELKFLQNGETKINLVADSYGYYSSSLPPDIYDIEATFPQSKLYLDGVTVNSFDDPIKYRYSDTVSIPGMRNAGLFSYEVALSYSSVDIELIYVEKNVLNEDNLRIFKCSNWNAGKEVCNSNWMEIDGDIDTVRNRVKITSTTLSSFVVGEIKGLIVDFSLDKSSYNLKDKIKITGIIKDEDGIIVSNANVEAVIKGTGIVSKGTADNNGVFSLELQTPDNEGTWEINLKVKKYPYNEFSGNKKFEMIKSKDVLIDFPETIKIAIGENSTQKIGIVNTGQADIYNLKAYLEGIPEGYYKFSENLSLKSGEEKTFYVNFFIPFYAEKGISSATIKVEGNNLSEEKVFGLNIFEKGKNINETLPTTGLASGFALPEINYLDVVYIVVLTVACFSAAILLKKRKIFKTNRKNITVFLFDVKNFIKKNEDEIQNESYDKVILTEFPNFMKFSKKILGIKGDDIGKDN